MSLHEVFGGSNSFKPATGIVGASFNAVLVRAQWLQAALGAWGIASIVAGLSLACFGAIFAVQQGASFALTLMAAYCVVTTCIACTVTVALLYQRSPKAATTKPAPMRPNIAAWRLVSELRVADACRLWCDIEPGSPYSQDAIAWATAMLDAIKKGDLAILARSGGPADLDERERTNPSWRTRISRESLKAWAGLHGYCPAFLEN